MGGDGGSIPNRIDLVKTKGYGSTSQGSMGSSANGMRRLNEEVIDIREQRRTRMTTCALTGQTLVRPVAACRAGFLFNKDAIVERLLSKSMPEDFKHITSLKDVVELRNFPGTCPLTARDLSDGRSEVMWPCGCVISEKGLNSLSNKRKSTEESSICVSCSNAVDLRTKLAPDSEEFAAQLQTAMDMRAKKHASSSETNKSDKKGSSVSSRKMKETAEERDAVLKKYKSSSYREIFHS